jgi:hypothetical protein
MSSWRDMDTSQLTRGKRFWSSARWLALGLLLGYVLNGILTGTWRPVAAKPSEPAGASTVESYQIMSYDATSRRWGVLAVNRETGGKVLITAVCDFYKAGALEPVVGPDSCDVRVGETIVPDRLPPEKSHFVDVWQLGDKLFVTRGVGPERVHQQFTVLAAAVQK